MTITCETLEQFLNTIEGLVHRGICFKADANTFTIKVTGGF